jgi:RHS repeat-associated protein
MTARRVVAPWLALAASSLSAAEVGTTAGSFAVSPTGSASYTIPIAVPPGIAGMQPNLAIVYDSNGGNGPLGVGFALSGLSQIARCPATVASDGFAGAIELDVDDRFCLDGQKLVVLSGLYGGYNAEYRTEIETFQKIRSFYGWGFDPSYFQVQTRDGMTLQFGGTADSRIDGSSGSNKALVWALNKITDLAGNSITVIWEEGPGYQVVPKSISYAWSGKNGTGSSGATVDFTYGPRNDAVTVHVGGVNVPQTKLLTKITTAANGVTAREYRFDYDYGGHAGRARLNSVAECAGDGTCLPPTTFAWPTHTTVSWTTSSVSGPPIAHPVAENCLTGSLDSSGRTHMWCNAGNGSSTWQVWNGSSYFSRTGPVVTKKPAENCFTGDLNGDGITDMWCKVGSNFDDLWDIAFSNGYFNWNVSRARGIPTQNPVGERCMVGELNGDGRADMWCLANATSGSTWRVAYSTGAGWIEPADGGLLGVQSTQQSSSDSLAVPDVDTSALLGTPGTSWMSWSGPAASVPIDKHCLSGDLNGDGLSDMWCSPAKGSTSWAVALTMGSGWQMKTWTGPAAAHPVSNYCFTGDFNGDGLSDTYCGNGGYPWTRALSTGSGWRSTTLANSASYVPAERCIVADVIGDGRVDALCRNSSSTTQWDVGLYTESGWSTSTRSGPGTAYPISNRCLFGDFKGTGRTDIFCSSSSGSASWQLGHLSLLLHDRVTAIATGAGARVEIDYKPMTDASVHTRGSAQYPQIGGQFPLYLVSEHRVTNGVGGMSRVTYQYSGSRLDLTGRGWLGFSKRIVRDDIQGIRETKEYRQDFPFTGMPSSVLLALTSGSMVSRQTIVYASRTLGTGAGQRQFPYVSSTTTEQYEISPNAHLVSTDVTEYTYDDFGNVTETVQQVLPGTLASVMWGGSKPPINLPNPGVGFTIHTINDYQNDEVNWRLGRLTASRVMRYTPTGLSGTRTSAFEYNSTYGLLSAEIIEPNSPLEVRTEYGRDYYGNITSRTVSGLDFSSRTTREEFSSSYPYYGRFSTRSINALGHSASRVIDPLTGNVTSTTDPNGLITNFTYDAFGRKTGESFNQHGINTWAQTERLWCSQVSYCGPGDVFAIRSTSAAGAESYVIFDMLERETRRQSKSPDGAYVEVLTEYNAKGQVVRRSSPRFANSSYTYWTTYTYDAVGRVIREDAPIDQNTPSGRISRVEYNGLVTRQFDALNHMNEQETDALGNVVRVTDAAGGQTLRAYDAFNNLIATTDAENAVTQFLYDIRGRKIQMKEPNMGTWLYHYNALGELIRQVDAKGQVVEMTYDLLGRMVGRTEPEGTALWEYDTLRKGALSEVTDQNYRRYYTYYPHGGVKEEIVHVSTEGALHIQPVPLPDNPLDDVPPPDDPVADLQRTLCEDWGLCGVEEPESPGMVAYNTMYAPPADLDGQFKITWGPYLADNPSPLLGTCNGVYTLVMSRNAEFTGATVIYAGPAREFQFMSEVPGAHYFRVKAIYHQIGTILESCSQYSSQKETAYYTGPNRTEVLFVGSNHPNASSNFEGSSSGASAAAMDGFLTSVTHYEYDQLGRNSRITYPSGFAVENSHNAINGALDKVHKPGDPASTYWQGLGWDEWGNAYLTRLGNGVETLRSHDAAVGHLSSIMSGVGGGTDVQSLNYGWDRLGNLTYRADGNQGGLREDFEYDQLNRLTRSTLTGVPTMGTFENLRMTYAANGNVTYKSDVGSYAYGAQPHAVAAAGTKTYAYDPNGNLVSGAGRVYIWASYNLPLIVTNGSNSSEFLYGPERQRIRQVVNGSKTIYYAGALYEEHHTSSGVEKKHFINTPEGPVAVETWNSSGAKKTEYLHKDHLGSTDVITNQSGQVVQRLSFDAFGKRRALNWTAGSPSVASLLTARGFTGHEHLDNLGLIHMNGRVYDPHIGRFISADPFVQAPGNTQSYNRYTYAMNNPLSYTDPSGFFSLKKAWKSVKRFFKKYWRPIVAIVAAVVTYGYASAWAAGWAGAGFVSGAIGGAAAGAVSGGILTGSWKGALTGALAGAAVGGLASYGALGRAVGGGVNGYLQGGNSESFLRGFGAGVLPNNLGMNAFQTNAAANIAIGFTRDALRGYIVGGKDGIKYGLIYGQGTNLLGHMVAAVSARSLPTFKEGMFVYEGGSWERRALTLGNVVAGPTGLSMSPEFAAMYQHERNHYSQPVEQSLGATYFPVHILDQVVGRIGDYLGFGYSWYMFEEHLQNCPYSRLENRHC